ADRFSEFGEITAWHVTSSVHPAKNDYQPDRGYFFTSDNTYHYCAEAYAQTHAGKLPGDLAVTLSIDGKSLFCPWLKRCPTIAADWTEIGMTAFEECERLLNPATIHPRRIYLPGRLTSTELIPSVTARSSKRSALRMANSS
ncbi:MAG: hypothetical protein AB7F32_11190, partial [Victivallaceae bacterium]